ncbi:MAG: D-2-hydroxyacid dehydrogenase [Bryobacteraceae bacterium]
MRPVNLLVISPPNAKHLSVLEKLPDSTTITVGRHADAFESAAPEADVILNGLGNGDTLKQIWNSARKVQWVHSLSAGVEKTLFPELIASPVPITNARGVFKRSLGEFAVSAILFFAKDLRRMVRNQEAAVWEQFDVEEIHGRTLGIVGYGEIGRATAERAHALGMKIVALRRRPGLASDPIVEKFYSVEDRAAMMSVCDYVVAAAPHTEDTHGLIGEKELAAMKPSGVIINVGRGPVINEAALVKVLQERRIKGAGLDVFDKEPLPPDHPFWKLDNVLLSPHCADHTSTWMEEAMEFFVSNFERFTTGVPLENVVDKNAGY